VSLGRGRLVVRDRAGALRRGRPAGLRTALAAAIALAVLAAATPVAAAEPLFGFGDSGAIYTYEGSPDAETLAELEAEAGAEVGRFTVRWEVVQPTPPPEVGPPLLSWERYDPLVEAMRERGIRPLPVLLGAPSWARAEADGCDGDVCPPAPDRVGEWRSLVAAAASRYADAAAIEVWNEPNRLASWATDDGPDPGRYAELLVAAETEVERLAGRRTDVVVGGLGLIEERGEAEGNMSIGDFLAGLYAALAPEGPGVRTAIGVHVYPGLEELERPRPSGRWAKTFAEVRAARARSDPDPDRELWVTEFGASTTAPAPDGEGTTSPELQAASVTGGLEALEDADDVAAAIVYTVVDRPPSPQAPSEEGFGLVGRGPEFSPKPAYCELAAARGAPVPARCEGN
jgi:polysaccharide biosynthesis protein PslG